MKEQKTYLQQRFEMKLNGPKPEAVKRQEKKEKGEFFATQIKNAPDRCEECGKSLVGTKIINPAAIVCHIVPKSTVPSVATHPDNRFFGCSSCHHSFDNKGASFIIKMKIFPILKERVAKFYHLIAPNEKRRVPECLRPDDKK